MPNPKRGNEIPTIDVSLITVGPSGSEIALDTASKIQVSVQSETQDAKKLIIKGILRAQKREKTVVTGNTIVLTDNVFNPELVKTLQGGEILYWTSEEQISTQGSDAGFGVASYTPPVSGEEDHITPFPLNAYSARYDEAGLIKGYEKITYPNCTGVPVALSSEDDVFRVSEYTINSAPKKGEAPYKIEYVKTLPVVE